jgi:hypothetical protein
MKMREDGLIERPPNALRERAEVRYMNDGEKVRTYHNINGMWGEKMYQDGEWAIYKPEFTSGVAKGRFNNVLIHSRIWEEKRVVHKEPPMSDLFRYREGAEVMQPHFETETIELVCHTQMFPFTDTECRTCRMTIPEGIIAIWKMMNMEHLSEEL